MSTCPESHRQWGTGQGFSTLLCCGWEPAGRMSVPGGHTEWGDPLCLEGGQCPSLWNTAAVQRNRVRLSTSHGGQLQACFCLQSMHRVPSPISQLCHLLETCGNSSYCRHFSEGKTKARIIQFEAKLVRICGVLFPPPARAVPACSPREQQSPREKMKQQRPSWVPASTFLIAL